MPHFGKLKITSSGFESASSIQPKRHVLSMGVQLSAGAPAAAPLGCALVHSVTFLRRLVKCGGECYSASYGAAQPQIERDSVQ